MDSAPKADPVNVIIPIRPYTSELSLCLLSIRYLDDAPEFN